MNTARKIGLVLVASLFTTACASSPQARLGPKSQDLYEQDTEYVLAIEKAARAAGAEVIWLNPPYRARKD